MSKAVEGAAMIALGVGLMVFAGPAMPFPLAIELFVAGAGMATSGAASLIADALTGNRAMNITTRAVAGLRQIVYGMQRLGGTTIYQSTTGAGGSSGNYVYNFVIVLATHEIDAVLNVYLDGRQVFWRSDGYIGNVGAGTVATPPAATATIAGGSVTGITATGGAGFANVAPARYRVRIYGGGGSGAKAYATGGPGAWVVNVTTGGSGYTTAPNVEIQGAYTFGGHSRSDDPDPSHLGYHLGYGIGPGGAHYNFDGKVYAEMRFGDQSSLDLIEELVSNDPAWTQVSRGGANPYVGGCAYLYLNVGYDTAMFPTLPEVRVTMTGKNSIYDPRTGLTGYSSNWALCVADVLTDPEFGVGDPNINTAQLIAAANVCDEWIETSQGPERNYSLDLHYDTSTTPGDALAMMMPGAAGRLSYIGGEWFIWPAYWQGPSFTFDESALIAPPTWNPYRSFRELINRITGTYTAPNFPYSCAGNLYDANGWYYGTTDNVWAFAWQPTNFPMYACDPLHGYASDVYLTEDGGVQLPQELNLRTVISIVQAQRVAKIAMLRNRQQGSGTFAMMLAAWQMQETDVMQFNFPVMNWTNKMLEVTHIDFICEAQKSAGGAEGALALTTSVSVIETDPSVYEWALSEELTPYDVPAAPGSISANPAAPTGLTLIDNTATAVLLGDGVTTIPRLLINWIPPADTYVNNGGKIQVQWADYSGVYLGGGWIDAGVFDGNSTYCYIDGIEQVTLVNVQVRAVRGNGAMSPWASVNNHSWSRPSAPIVHTTRPVSQSVMPGGSAPAISTTAYADLPNMSTSSSGMTETLAVQNLAIVVNLAFSAAGNSNIPIYVRVLMDGAAIMGPVELVTDAAGFANWNATQIVIPTPTGSHSFQVQAYTLSTVGVTITSSSFNLINLA